jgi:hypothetical protein
MKIQASCGTVPSVTTMASLAAGKTHSGTALLKRHPRNNVSLNPGQHRGWLSAYTCWVNGASFCRSSNKHKSRSTANRVENAIRPFVIGRRNCLFSQTTAGAAASARLYSLVETARANGIEPHAYLSHLFAELPRVTTAENFEALLPWNLSAALRSR